MGILLAFAPFIAFAIVNWLVGPVQGLVAGALVSAALLARDWFTPGRIPKTLEVGTTVLFGALAFYALIARPTWSVVGVRLCVDAGLLCIVIVTMVLGRPFTLQYARERVSSEYHSSPQFIRINYVITAAWALAFAVMVLAELAMLYLPSVPHRIGVIAIIVALVGAVRFTGWYPEHARRRATA